MGTPNWLTETDEEKEYFDTYKSTERRAPDDGFEALGVADHEERYREENEAKDIIARIDAKTRRQSEVVRKRRVAREEVEPSDEAEPTRSSDVAEVSTSFADPSPSMEALERRLATLNQIIAAQEQRAPAQAEILRLQEENRKIAEIEASIPKYEEDPIAHIAAKQNLLAQTLVQKDAEERQAQEAARRAYTLQEGERQFAHAVNSADQAARKRYSDFDEAVAYLGEVKRREFEALGYADPQQQVIADSRKLAAALILRGEDPGEGFYKLAKVNGWKGKSAPAAKPGKVSRKGKSLPPSSLPDIGALAASDAETFDREFNRFFSRT